VNSPKRSHPATASKTLRESGSHRGRPSVLDCGGPPLLFLSARIAAVTPPNRSMSKHPARWLHSAPGQPSPAATVLRLRQTTADKPDTVALRLRFPPYNLAVVPPPWPAAARACENGFGRAVSRILSSALRPERIICLSSQYPEPIPLARELERAAPVVPYLALHPMGFAVPPRLRLGRCALTAPFHPDRAGCPARRSQFLWHCPSARLSANRPRVSPAEPELRGIAPCGVRTFLPRREPGAILHPSEAGATIGPERGESKVSCADQ